MVSKSIGDNQASSNSGNAVWHCTLYIFITNLNECSIRFNECTANHKEYHIKLTIFKQPIIIKFNRNGLVTQRGTEAAKAPILTQCGQTKSAQIWLLFGLYQHGK